MADLEHPDITRTLKTGYPEPEPRHWGIDYFGNEILEGDQIVVDPTNGEVILESNLQDYLIEALGFQFKTAGEDE